MSVALTLLSTSICSKPKRFVVDAIKISSVSDSDRFFSAISYKTSFKGVSLIGNLMF